MCVTRPNWPWGVHPFSKVVPIRAARRRFSARESYKLESLIGPVVAPETSWVESADRSDHALNSLPFANLYCAYRTTVKVVAK